MKQFCKDAQEFAVRKAKSEQQKDEIKCNLYRLNWSFMLFTTLFISKGSSFGL